MHHTPSMRRSTVAASLSIALLVSAAPVFGGPVRVGDQSAPFAGWSVGVFPGTEDVPLDSISAPRPVVCAWPVVEDESMPGMHAEVSSADLLPPADLDGRVRLIDDVVDCSGATATAAGASDDDPPPLQPEPGPQPSGRLRSALQTLAIMSALAAVGGLGWLVAVFTRRPSHGLRRSR